MEAIVIEIKNEADIKFWLNLAKKTGTRAKSINTEVIEDSNLAANASRMQFRIVPMAFVDQIGKK